MGIFSEVWELLDLMNYFFLVLHSQSENFAAGWMVCIVIEEIADQIYDHQQLIVMSLYV
jgi:hypothetical protein